MDQILLRFGPVFDQRLDRRQISHDLSEAARREMVAFVRAIPPSTSVTDVPVDGGQLAHLRADLETCRRRVEHSHRMVVVAPVTGLNFRERRIFAWMLANLLGEPVVQNTEGDRLIGVYARPGTKRIADGARYHQTREGGSSHTDNVSLPDLFDYLVFSCIRPAGIGGESILISGFAVHDELQAFPEALDILRRPFWWEYRGISASLFQAPIITYNHAGEPRFRYLRRYLESAHLRAGEPLTAEQVWALDTLDAILDRSSLQFRILMNEGEILVAYDSQVLHARTTFCDRSPGAPGDLAEAAAGPWRFFDRAWVRKGATWAA